MKHLKRTLALWLVGNLLLCSGCSMLTAQGRRERAYAHYVAKYSRGRVKQQRKLSGLFHAPKMPHLEPSEPVESTQAGEAVGGPESISSASDANSGGGGL
jgi:hypothetical protein